MSFLFAVGELAFEPQTLSGTFFLVLITETRPDISFSEHDSSFSFLRLGLAGHGSDFRSWFRKLFRDVFEILRVPFSFAFKPLESVVAGLTMVFNALFLNVA